MKVKEPTIFKSKAFKRLMSEPPKCEVRPIMINNKEDIKRAKILQKLLNHMYKNNINGITTRYLMSMKEYSRSMVEEVVHELQVGWDIADRIIKNKK